VEEPAIYTAVLNDLVCFADQSAVLFDTTAVENSRDELRTVLAQLRRGGALRTDAATQSDSVPPTRRSPSETETDSDRPLRLLFVW
jgi:hypothetical protein